MRTPDSREHVTPSRWAMFGIDAGAAKIAWTVFLIGLGVYVMYALRGTLLLLVLAIFFAYVALPLAKILDAATLHRLPRPVVVVLLFALMLLCVVAFGVVIGNRVADEASGLSTQLPRMLDPNSVMQRIPLPSFLEAQRERIAASVVAQLRASAEHMGPFAQRVGKGLWHGVGGLIDVAVVLILGFFLTKDAPLIQTRMQKLLAGSGRSYWAEVVPNLNTLLGRYVRALALLSLITFVCYGVALGLLGVPYAALLASVAAILEAVPVVGPLCAAIAIVAVCLLSGYPHLLWVVAFIAAYRGLQDYAVAPHLIGREVELSSLAVIVALLAGEEIGGIVGMFLAVPVLAAAKILISGRSTNT